MSAKTAWVLGGSGAWGGKCAIALADLGYSSVLLSRSAPRSELLELLEARGYPAVFHAFDLACDCGSGLIVALPLPDIYIHCAGVFEGDLARLTMLNFTKPALLMEALLAELARADKPCRFGVFLGQNGRLGLPGLAPYSAGIGALWTWGEAKSRELRAQKLASSLSLVFPPRIPSALQAQLAQAAGKDPKTDPRAKAHKLIEGVISGEMMVGRSALLPALAMLRGI